MSSLRLVCVRACVRMNSASSPSKTASFARPYWNAATCYGTAHATTTFHEQYNKHDYRYSYGRCGEFVRQDGLRGLALGYCTKVRFTRFLTTPLATELTGIDLTRPGQSAAQAARVAEVADAFFDLLVRYSHSHPYRDGDYGNVMRSRKLPRDSFCIFTGFAEALASPELETLRAMWRARYPSAKAPPAPPTPPPPKPEAPQGTVASQPPLPPPSPGTLRSAAASLARTSPKTIHLEALEARLVAEYERASDACVHSHATSPSGCAVHACTGLYTVQTVIARRGVRAGRRQVVAVTKGALRRALHVTAMRSMREIRDAFERPKRSCN